MHGVGMETSNIDRVSRYSSARVRSITSNLQMVCAIFLAEFARDEDEDAYCSQEDHCNSQCDKNSVKNTLRGRRFLSAFTEGIPLQIFWELLVGLVVACGKIYIGADHEATRGPSRLSHMRRELLPGVLGRIVLMHLARVHVRVVIAIPGQDVAVRFVGELRASNPGLARKVLHFLPLMI